MYAISQLWRKVTAAVFSDDTQSNDATVLDLRLRHASAAYCQFSENSALLSSVSW